MIPVSLSAVFLLAPFHFPLKLRLSTLKNTALSSDTRDRTSATSSVSYAAPKKKLPNCPSPSLGRVVVVDFISRANNCTIISL